MPFITTTEQLNTISKIEYYFFNGESVDQNTVNKNISYIIRYNEHLRQVFQIPVGTQVFVPIDEAATPIYDVPSIPVNV